MRSSRHTYSGALEVTRSCSAGAYHKAHPAATRSMKTETIEASVYRIPLATPIQAASTPVMTEFDLVMVRLRDSDGASGCGYTVLSAGQGAAVAAIVDNVFAKIVLTEDPRRIQWLWSRMWRSHHYAGRG